jgi:hypothetical protein
LSRYKSTEACTITLLFLEKLIGLESLKP